MPRERTQWLNGPTTGQRADGEQCERARAAVAQLRQVCETRAPGCPEIRRLMLCEAQTSSYIESIFDEATEQGTKSNRLFRATTTTLATRNSRDVLKWHLTLMAHHPEPRMRPGHYRDSGVVIGNWTPPHHSELFWRMERFHEWMDRETDPIMRAIYGHRWFETIHPFADGNGRTGRLLIIQAIDAPAAVSRHIWRDQLTYYRLLSQGAWTEWRDWMAGVIRDAALQSAADLDAYSGEPTQEQITAMSQRPALAN